MRIACIELTLILRQDIVTGDEIISDSYPMKEVDGIVYEVDCAMVTQDAVNVGRSIAAPHHDPTDLDTSCTASENEPQIRGCQSNEADYPG